MMNAADKTTPFSDPGQRLFRDLVESAQDLFWQIDTQGHFRYLNPAWERLFGYSMAEMIGKSFTLFQTPDTAARDQAFMAEVMALPAFHDYETVLLRKDGTPVYSIFSGKQVFADDGVLLGMQGFGYDITQRKQAEMELRISEERYRQLSDSAFEGIMIHEQGVMLDMNHAFVSMFGYDSKAELIGRNSLAGLIAPRSLALIRDRIQNNVTDPMEVYCLRRDGGEFVGMTQTRLVTFQGKQARIITMNDITARKHAEEALKAERERLAVTLRSIGDGVIATNTEGKVMILNVIAERLTGWSQQEAEGRPLNEVFRIIHEISRNDCENPVDKVLSTGEIIELANHTVLIGRDGTERVIEDSGAPIRNAEGKTIGVVLVFRDTTEKKKLTEAAQRTQKLESLGILAGGIAHDFNNLLGGIFGYIDLVHAKSSDETIAHYLAKALSTIDRARALTQQLLTFAKGGVPIRKVAALFPLVEDTVNFALSGAAVTSRFRVAPDLKPCDFDRNQICQVIDNLAINALQAMPMGGTLSVTAENIVLRSGQLERLPPGAYVRLSLRDTGIGIPPEILPRIFDPFFTTKQKGSGLGLATCYSILKQHDGGIDVESEPGKGTVFHLFLPAAAGAPAAEIIREVSSMTGKGRFILMDDEAVIRETTGEMLRMMGYEVVTFAEGKAVIEYLRKQPPGLPGIAAILLDLTIPGGIGGLEVVGEIRKLSAAIPIFVSSGYADDPVMAMPQNYGITGSIGKPFRIAGLTEMLKKYLQ
jgi:PAS domain S-box-containing protein